MTDVILRRNGIPVYGFLSHIAAQRAEGESPPGTRILDCGAGGVLPPLALFRQQGFEAWGVDVSGEQLRRARAFCDKQGLELHLHEGDMRCLPFRDETFDYVYEHYSMCHLSKRDTTRAIREMQRVLKKGGLCFLGVIGRDSWPTSSFGEEREPGEFWMREEGEEPTRHSLFADGEAERLVAGWEIIRQEKHVRYLRAVAEETSLDDWMALHGEARSASAREDWRARYDQRAQAFHYVHMYYTLRKPA
jgi:ubiquinone/menaquinone biosynthesis C-methylase UbiE